MEFWIVVCLFTWLGLSESVDYKDTLTEQERSNVFGNPSSLNLPKVESVYLTALSNRPEEVRYRLRWNDREVDLTLTPPEHPLFSPGCIVHHYYKNKMKTISPCNTDNNCFYTGKSDNHTDSWIAADICDGMKGVIKLEKDVLYIHPDPHSQHSVRSVLHPYIVYRYNSSAQKACGTEATGPNPADHLYAVHRESRSARKKFIETRLVIDPEMMNFHRQDGRSVQDYVSVLFNIAKQLYEQPSLGDRIILTVSDIIYVESHEEFGSNFTNDAQRVLNMFCQWKPSSSHSKIVPDANILLTRRNLVYKGNNVNGLGNTGCLCLEGKKCAVVQDIGPYTGHALAHEIGHLLGMHHDGEHNNCTAGIMSKNGASGEQAFTWSSCSRKNLQDYIRSSQNSCLYNDPTSGATTNLLGMTPSTMSQLPPGYIFTADEQCQLMHDTFSYNMPQKNDSCSQLVCMKEPGHTAIKNTPPLLDGTDINNTRTMCWKGVAVAMNSTLYLDPIHGNYSDWEAGWSLCSRTCGGGVMLKKRACDNPRPRYGGRPCDGPDVRAVLCNMDPCPDNILHRKCDKFNIAYQGNSWRPIISEKENPCKVHCTNGPLFQNTSGNAPDGTSCGLNLTQAYSRCVNGECRRFGCDGHMDSGTSYDHCQVCYGSHVGCRQVSGTYQKEDDDNVYTDVITIPANSTSVIVTESNQFCRLSLSINGTRYTDAARRHNDGPYTYGGVTFFITNYRAYENNKMSPYYLRAAGPLPVNITIQAYRLFSYKVYASVSPNITYSYYVPTVQTSELFTWKVVFTPCSKSCDTGIRRGIIKCSSNSTDVPDYHCDINKKPTILPEPCNSHSCPTKWETSSWTPCSHTCDNGTRVREVYCTYRYHGKDQKTNDTSCSNQSRPISNDTCFVRKCPGVWKTEAYGACSKSCGNGIKERQVLCYESTNSTTPVDDQYCDGSTKPTTSDNCFETFCVYSSSCSDIKTNCSWKYGNDICLHDYQEWAFEKCQLFCKVCASCADDVDEPNVCASFVNINRHPPFCEHRKYWAQIHCRNKCGYCTACGMPPVVSNGNVSGHTSYDVGSEVKYTCTLGYEFVNESLVRCERGGVWSKAPECKAICGPTPSVANGTIIQGESRFVGSVVYYACAPGYNFTHGVSSVQCLDHGMWTQAPVCEATCGPPPSVANATIIQGDSRFVGSVVYYACAPGYNFTHDVSSVQCLDHGMWTRAPVCEAVCVNKRANCAMYDTSFCSEPKYKAFWTNNCPKSCGFC